MDVYSEKMISVYSRWADFKADHKEIDLKLLGNQ